MTNQILDTLGDVFNFMSPYAGGSVPSEEDAEYANWLRWVGVAQETFAKRGFWRRLLTKTDLAIVADSEYTVLPDNFHKVNGIYTLTVDSVDWSEPGNTDSMTLFVELDLDSDSSDYGKWRVRYSTAPSTSATGTLWFYAGPEAPTTTTDKIILPGDMVAFGALIEYFRGAGEEGSQDDVRIEAENRFTEYLALEVIPSRQELASFSTYKGARFDRTAKAKELYTRRPNRNTR